MKFFNSMAAVVMLLCLLLASNAGASGCDCSKFPDMPAELKAWCQEVKDNGTLFDYKYFQENETAQLVIDSWEPYVETATGFFPAKQIDRTPHAVTSRDEYDYEIELDDVTVTKMPTEECAVLSSGGDCENIGKALPETSIAFEPDYYKSPTEVDENTNCYVQENVTDIEVTQPVTGHGLKLFRYYYTVKFNHRHAVEDKAGQTTTEVVVQNNPCPNNCDVQTGACTPCYA